jgi:hypothetical protein
MPLRHSPRQATIVDNATRFSPIAKSPSGVLVKNVHYRRMIQYLARQVAELVVMDPHMVPWMQEQFPDVDGPVAALSKVYLMMRLRLRNTPTGFVGCSGHT